MATWTEQSTNSASWNEQALDSNVGTLANGSPIGLLLTLTYSSVSPDTSWSEQSLTNASWTEVTPN